MGQLECGARAFDYRPFVEDGNVIAHHGDIVIKHNMADSIDEVIAWIKSSGTEDLVVLYVSHLEGPDCSANCQETVKNVLKDRHVAFVDSCSQLENLEYTDARTLGAVSGSEKGGLLAIFDCMEENYDPDVTCYGFEDKTRYCCYDQHSENAWAKLDGYLMGINENKAFPPSSGVLWMTQAHWQSSTESVPMGVLHRSSVLLDESRAFTNQKLDSYMQSGRVTRLNMFEVDNVCDSGTQLYE